ncbi:hypothetical protein DSM43276_03450 [Mycobacteroides salmoniphilum]|nr:hypothetical protein DSM43276_03450 [Mycobacteroides salmoniphilum]
MNPLAGNRVLRTHAARFRDWLEEYPGNEIGYPEWKHVEDHFSELLTTGGICRLDQDGRHCRSALVDAYRTSVPVNGSRNASERATSCSGRVKSVDATATTSG